VRIFQIYTYRLETDEELVLALEACEDNSIGYAVYGEKEINLDITNESCKMNTSTTFMRRK
jgi:hypothetical protein